LTYNAWYESQIEEPMRELVYLLRNNGFNTIWSCGHPPKPYITFESYRPKEDLLLEKLLIDKGYENFSVEWKFYGAVNRDMLSLIFHSVPENERGLIDKKYLKNKVIDISPRIVKSSLPEDIVLLLDSDCYRVYQPVTGYSRTSAFRKEIYDNIIKAISQFDIKGKKILEPGPLYGYFSFELAKLGAEVTAIERDEKKYEICTKLAEYYDIPVNFIHEDIVNYDFRNTDFDILLFMNVFHHILANNNYIGRSLIYRASAIPKMIFSMGITRGRNCTGWTHDMVGPKILEMTQYTYTKKIAMWGNRKVYYFE